MANDHDTIIKIKKLGFTYGEGWIFRNLDIEVCRGDFLAVIGANGAGKSTLLRIIAHILMPTEGEILLYGCPTDKFKEWERVGYVPQNPARQQRNFPISVREVVQLGRLDRHLIFKRFSRRDESAIDDVIQRFSLAKLAHRKVGELSGGQQQRVFLARAMVRDPELLLLDEPATGVDADAKAALYKMLGELHQQGKTIVMVSHDLELAAQYAENALCLDQGVCFKGKMQDAIRHRHKHRYF